MNKTMIVLLIVTIIASVVVIADTSDHYYTATVAAVSNIIITELDVSFSNCGLAANCDQIASSLNIQNTGNQQPATGLSAVFTTNISASYGLVSGTDTINGTNFQLNSTALTANITTTEIIPVGSLDAGVDFNITADLAIPAGQAAGDYNGTIQLSWTA